MDFKFTRDYSDCMAEAECQLHHLQWQKGPNERRLGVLNLLQIFQRFPSLSLVDSYFGIGTPLHAFLKAEADIHYIKALCQICPQLFKLLRTRGQDTYQDSPLHMACRLSSTEVVEFLAEQTPNLWTGDDGGEAFNGHGLLPCHCAMLYRNDLPLATMVALLEQCPEAATAPRTWSLALLSGQPPEFLDAMVEKIPTHCTALEVDALINHHEIYRNRRALSRQPLNLGQARALGRLLPKLTCLKLYYPPGWDRDAFLHFLQVLQDNATISRIQKLSLPKLEEPVEVIKAVLQLLENNTGLRELGLVLRGESDILFWKFWVWSLMKGLAKNRTLASLRFDIWFRLQVAFCSWVALSSTADRNLTLCMKDFGLEHPDTKECLGFLAPYLGTLKLEGKPWFSQRSPSTTDIVAVLAGAPSMKSLEIVDYVFDAVPILEALGTHANLQVFRAELSKQDANPECRRRWVGPEELKVCYKMVQEDNLVLRDCYPWNAHDPRIQYYLDLNRFGRSRVRNAGGCSELVELLLAVQDNSNWDQYFAVDVDTWMDASHCNEMLTRHASIVYGLLREIPVLWCHTSV